MAAVSEEEPDHGIQLSSFTALLTPRRIPKVGHWNMCAGQLRVHATREAMQPAPSVKLAARRVSALAETSTSSSLGGVAPQRPRAGWSRSCSTANGVQVVTVMPRTLAPPATLNPGALSPPKQLYYRTLAGAGARRPAKSDCRVPREQETAG